MSPSAAKIVSQSIQRCRVCREDGLAVEMDLGAAAVSTFLPDAAGRDTPRIPFRLAACSRCGLVQLLETPALDLLRPPRQAIVFRDPERHLDDLCAAMIGHLPDRNGLVLGFCYKDAPLLDRFRQAGFSRTVLLDREDDWGLTDPRTGVETMQQTVAPEWAERIRGKYGPAMVLSVRHLLEHAHDVPRFLAGCRQLLADDGWAMFETPGCETELCRGDAGALWEEHVLYFTSTTLRVGLERHAFRCRWMGNYPYAVEDCLAAFGRFQSSPCSTPDESVSEGRTLLAQFGAARQQLRIRLQAAAESLSRRGRNLALWGAGHRTATLVELLPAHGLIACVIDEDPEKQGKFLPGSDVPILPSSALDTESIGLCVGVLNPDVMAKIAARHQDYVARGGRFATLSELAVGSECP